jgi:DNA polymerase-3 subunit delta'
LSVLPWLEAPLGTVKQLHASSRLPHALLIRAGEGWGEVALADQLALYLLGREDAETARNLAHPDLKWVEPEGSVIKVDDIREVAAFAVGTRQMAAAKVVVIEAAELMNPSAANALLKTLEEPPADTYLLLATAQTGRLLPTIVSRCQSVLIGRDLEAARVWLAERWPPALLEEKLFECGDAPLSVQQALEQEEPPLGPSLREISTARSASQAVADLLAWDVDRLTSAWYRHCGALMAGESRISGLAVREAAKLAEFTDELLSVRRQLLSTNSANQRLLYERLAVRWQGAVSPD